MSSSEEDYGRTERPLPKPSHSAHTHGKTKYSETPRVSETSGVSTRYQDPAGGRIPYQESSARYCDGSGAQHFSHGCSSGRYPSSDNGNGSPRYSDQNNSRFSETNESIIRYPAENRSESCRNSRCIDSSTNLYQDSSSKVSKNSERLPNDGERYQNENHRYSESGGKYSNSSVERYLLSSPAHESSMDKYAKNDHYLRNDKSDITSERNIKCIVGTPVRLDRNTERSSERYYSGGLERSERNLELAEKHGERISEKHISSSDRYVIHNAQEPSGTRGSERNSDRFDSSERINEDFLQSSNGVSSSDNFIHDTEIYRSNDRGDCYRSERFLCSSSLGEIQRFDRYCTLPSHSEKYSRKTPERFENVKYLPPPAPAPSERFHPPERYIPPPAPSSDRYNEAYRERYSETSSKERYQDRYLPPPPSERFIPASFDRFHAASVNPGDPYMRRDLGYHHHYRLPHPSYHIHQQSTYYNSHYQRTLPHRTLASYHSHQTILPSPSRAQLRCCPSSGYLHPEDINSNSSSSSHPSNVLTANITGQNLPVLAASLTNGQNLTSFSASVNVNIITAQGTNALQRERDHDYLPPCPSPLLTSRGGRPTSGNGGSRMTSSHTENINSNAGRLVSTPTPPPSLPRCSSLSNCEVNGESESYKADHSHHHYTSARRPCNGALEPGASLTLCCTSSRRNIHSPVLNFSNTIPTNQPNAVHGHSSRAFTETAPKIPSIGNLPTSNPMENQRQGIATSCSVTAPSNSLHNSNLWKSGNGQIAQSQSSSDSSRSSAQTPVTDSTNISAQSSLSSSSTHSANYCSPQPTSRVFEPKTNSNSDHIDSPVRTDQLKNQLIKINQSATSGSHSIPNQQRNNIRPGSLYTWAKNYMKNETISFFGVNEDNEASQQDKWTERRKRLALRKYGSLKHNIQPPKSIEDVYSRFTQSSETYGSRPDILPNERDESDGAAGWLNLSTQKKPSVLTMSFRGIAYLISTLTRHRPRTSKRSRQWSRSYVPSDVPMVPQFQRQSSSLSINEVFFDRTGRDERREITHSADEIDRGRGDYNGITDHFVTTHPARETQRNNRAQNWQRGRESPGTAGPEVGSSRIDSNFLGRAFDNSNRRQYGMGILGRLFGRKMKKSVTNHVQIKEQLDDLDDYRPFFTYWVTTVQVIILFISLFSYGFGPTGIDLNRKSGLVLVTSLSLQQVDYLEPANFWLGPRAADLIHLGAKYSPCMRRDDRIIKEMEKWREKERDTACCIRNDDSGCVQSSQADCSHNNLARGLEEPSKTMSTWKKWSPGEKGPGGRISGSVCGLDPKFCEAPASVAPHEWPDDITKWPICRKPQRYRQKDRSGKIATAEHMACEVIGHPCCIGIHGTCSITTKEYCDFVKGHFHEEASLCSQVSCLDDVCGMIPFYVPDHPDQFYRLWTSLFLHAGIVHIAVTLFIQLSLMRDLEKLTGPLRIGIIYIGSGVAGNLASAIFVPYRAEVGPAGSQFGLLACLVVEVLNVWPMLQRPENALIKLLGIVLILFLFGLLPWIDNYAHFFGFVFGFLLSYAFLPFVSFGPYDRAKKITLIWVCLIFTGVIFCALVVLFYIIPVYECHICNYFNCIPLTKDFCAEQNINFIKNPSLGDV